MYFVHSVRFNYRKRVLCAILEMVVLVHNNFIFCSYKLFIYFCAVILCVPILLIIYKLQIIYNIMLCWGLNYQLMTANNFGNSKLVLGYIVTQLYYYCQYLSAMTLVFKFINCRKLTQKNYIDYNDNLQKKKKKTKIINGKE